MFEIVATSMYQRVCFFRFRDFNSVKAILLEKYLGITNPAVRKWIICLKKTNHLDELYAAFTSPLAEYIKMLEFAGDSLDCFPLCFRMCAGFCL